jgi:hypothetical protein
MYLICDSKERKEWKDKGLCRLTIISTKTTKQKQRQLTCIKVSRYLQPKLTVAGVMKMLKRMRNILWGVHFTLEVDPTSLAKMLHSPEVPNAPITRWLSFIHLFDFDVRHVPGKKHVIPDVLSRVRRTGTDLEPESVGSVWGAYVELQRTNKQRFGKISSYLIEGAYNGWWKMFGEYLGTMERPEKASAKDYKKIRRLAAKHLLKDGRLYRRGEEGKHREVVMNEERQKWILKELHEEGGHRGVDETYARVKQRFWWPKEQPDVRR